MLFHLLAEDQKAVVSQRSGWPVDLVRTGVIQQPDLGWRTPGR
jgi:hypothetical protein